MKTNRIYPWFMMFILLFAALFFSTDHARSEDISVPASAQQWLDAHNNYRTIHGVPPVAWSSTVAASAQAWANTCPTGHSPKPPRTYGENIAYASYAQTPQGVVQRWYSEESDYNYNSPGFSLVTGHFTQVVWKNTTHIGCGCKTGCTTGLWSVCVCQYNPQGNISGQFPANVFAPSQPAPDKPTLTSPNNAATVSGSSVTFQWNAVSGATKYWLRIIRASDNSVFAQKDVGNVTSFTQSGFPNNGTEYRWSVAAGNSAGWGYYATYRTFTNGGTATVPGAPTLSAPANGATIIGTTISFSWNTPSGSPTKYHIQLSSTSSFTTTFIDDANIAGPLSYPGFPNKGFTYYWRVRAYNAAGWGPWSAIRNFVNGSTATVPGAPSLNSPANGATVNSTSVSFSWNKPTGNPTQYQIQLSSSSTFATSFSNFFLSGTSATGSGFPNTGARYYWRVRASNSSGWGQWSASRSFINGTVPPRVTLASPANHAKLTNSTVTLKWNAAARANMYWLGVWNSTIVESSRVFYQNVGNVTSYTLTLPRDGRKYYWMVTGGNSAGWGPWSYYRILTAPPPGNPGVMMLLLGD